MGAAGCGTRLANSLGYPTICSAQPRSLTLRRWHRASGERHSTEVSETSASGRLRRRASGHRASVIQPRSLRLRRQRLRRQRQRLRRQSPIYGRRSTYGSQRPRLGDLVWGPPLRPRLAAVQLRSGELQIGLELCVLAGFDCPLKGVDELRQPDRLQCGILGAGSEG